jgi:hypothetical protein
MDKKEQNTYFILEQDILESLEKLQNKLTNIWNHTELEMDDFSTTGLKKELNKISNIVNDLVGDSENIIMKMKGSTSLIHFQKMNSYCSHCQSDKVFVCEPCLEKMAEHYGE